jgi:spore coat protein CotH
MMKKILILAVLLAITNTQIAFGQGFPEQWKLVNGHELQMGKEYNTGLYFDSVILRMDITITTPNFLTVLKNNYSSKTNIPVKITYNGVTYDSVGLRFKGQTSYSMIQNDTNKKKSLNLEMNAYKKGQDINGVNTLNLNNMFDDQSFMREYLYCNLEKKHIPGAKANYVRVYVNNNDWGLYINVQQLNKDFYKEWYLDNDGSNFRADKPSTGGPGGPGGGPSWGDGTAALNDKGTDTLVYKQYYTLKSSTLSNPWTELVKVCQQLGAVNSSNFNQLDTLLDIDKALWFLAMENIFTDDDGYIYKGKMDYYLYQDKASKRFALQEFDGNSCFWGAFTSTWSPFQNQSNANFPLNSKLFAIPKLRQRYIAHYVELMKTSFDTTQLISFINWNKARIDSMVQVDPKKIYSYAQFNSGNTTLKNNIKTRFNYLAANPEIAGYAPPSLSNLTHKVNGVLWERPTATQTVAVNCQVTSTNGINQVNLYYSKNIYGKFDATPMFDDGLHNDAAANDGLYGASIPAVSGGSWVRYYVEAIANNASNSVAFIPVGAEHDVFTYLVHPDTIADPAVVINEVMASNTQYQQDEVGEFDDWIELFNRTNNPVDISDYAVTDNDLSLSKFQIPSGTILQPNSYLIIWADEDASQGKLHANFKLSSAGETISLLNKQKQVLNTVAFGTQITDSGYARIPNGSGNFIIKNPTFGFNNELAVNIASNPMLLKDMAIYPNPAQNKILIRCYGSHNAQSIQIFSATGSLVKQLPYNPVVELNASNWARGIYIIKCGNISKQLVLQ